MAAGVYMKMADFELRAGNDEAAMADLDQALALAAELPEPERRALSARIHFERAVAWMRRGENANCVARHTADSCIFPIQGEGVHVDQEGSRNAMAELAKAVELASSEDPVELAARWIWNVAAMTVGEWPDSVPEDVRIPREVLESAEEFPRFWNVATELDLDSFDLSGGVVTEDFDRDGDFDVLASTWDTSGPMRYYRNEGDGRFTERSSAAGLDGIVGGLNMNQADYDGDGWIDVLVMRGAWLGEYGRMPNSLLRNCGDGTFVDVAFAAGMTKSVPGQTGCWQDCDRDGDLDLFVGAEWHRMHPDASLLWRNDGKGGFEDVAREAGVENLRYAKGSSWGDFDNDGWPDLYVSNFSGENRLYHNQGDGTFVDVAEEAGVTEPLDSFPCWFWDFDNDGNLDLFVSAYMVDDAYVQVAAICASYLGLPHPSPLAHVYLGDGKGGFREAGEELGLSTVTYPMGANFGDLDNDGYSDVYLGTGFPSFSGLMPNLLYRNDRGRALVDVSVAAGLSHLQKGHGVAFCDVDLDGDLDVVEQMGGAYVTDGFGNALYENPGFGNRWTRIELVGTDSARCAIGARIRVDLTEDGERRSVHRQLGSGGSFGASSLVQHIGLGTAERIDRLVIRWPRSGQSQIFEDLPVDRRLRIVEGEGEYVVVTETPFELAR